MENVKSYMAVKAYFLCTWSPERQRVIKDLTCIMVEIQRQAKIHSIGSITYASVGLVGGGLAIAGIVAAPFTLGASLVLSVAGTAASVTSGVAGVTHMAFKIGIIKSKCIEAETSLKNHDKTSRKMITLMTDFLKDIQKSLHTLPKIIGGVTMLAKIVSLCGEVGESASSVIIDVSKGAAKLSARALGVIAALGIIVDLGSLISNAVDLSQMEEGKLCNEAQKLQEVIENLKKEHDDFSEFFD